MAGVKVVTDSACDLPGSLVEELHIEVVPLTVRFGDDEYVDQRDLTPEQFWAKVAASSILPETAAPSPGAFEAVFRRLAAEGADGIICINMSRDLSATIQSAEMAARATEVDDIPVTVIDSRVVSMGLGMLVLRAARQAAAGEDLAHIVAEVNAAIPRIRIFAALDTLENLKKGGRIGNAQALLGSLLSIKPIIEIRGGKVEEAGKQRTRAKALAYLFNKVKQDSPVDDLAVMQGAATDTATLVDQLSTIYSDEILVADLGAVVGSHGGPGLIGVVFLVPE